MKNKVLKQMLAFSLAVALVGGNSVATFAAEPTNGTESSANTQAETDATAEKVAVVNFNIENGKFEIVRNQERKNRGIVRRAEQGSNETNWLDRSSETIPAHGIEGTIGHAGKW